MSSVLFGVLIVLIAITIALLRIADRIDRLSETVACNQPLVIVGNVSSEDED